MTILTITEDGNEVFKIGIPSFDLFEGVTEILSAISNLPKPKRIRKPRADKGIKRTE